MQRQVKKQIGSGNSVAEIEKYVATVRSYYVDMSDLTGQSILNNTCLGDCRDERRTTASEKRLRVLEQIAQRSFGRRTSTSTQFVSMASARV
jgi:hypothetical protein